GDRGKTPLFIYLEAARRELELAGTRHRTAVNPGDMLARLPVELREITADDQVAIRRLDDQCVDGPVGPQAKVDAGIHRTGGQQACDVATVDPVGQGELAGHQNAIVHLHGNGVDRAVDAGGDGAVEGRVQRAVGIQARNMVRRGSVDAGEVTADQHPAIQLDSDGAHRAAYRNILVEVGVQR